jgi:hypothetical protein
MRTMACAYLRPVLAIAMLCAAACGDDGASSGEDDTTGSEGGSSSGDPTVTGGTPPTTSADTSSTGEPPASYCAGPTALVYDPLAMRLDAFPDDVFTVDEDTATGVRVDLRPGENIVLDEAAMPFASLFVAASTIDGWGTTGGLYLQFDGPLDEDSLPPASNDAPSAEDGLVLVDLDADPIALVPIEWTLVAEDPGEARTTLVVEPLVPLVPMHRHGLALTTAVLAEDGECIAPSLAMQSLLDGTAEDAVLSRVQPRIADFVDALVGAGAIDSAFDVTAAVVFTTQHTVDDSAAIATEIREADPPTFTSTGPCEPTTPPGDFVVCNGTLDVLDYTGPDERVADDLSAQGGYALPVRVWLPTTGTAPFPVFVYGHGLSGDRDQGSVLAEFAAPIGHAVVAVDAPKHGDHPDSGSNAVLDFFGLELNFADPLDSLKLRDNFRQGTYDRLQLVRAIAAGLDVDGDDEVDLDGARMHYLGVSLGGIMGAELMAFAPEFHTGVLIVPGARVGNIVEEGQQFELVINFFAGSASEGEIARFFPLLQAVIDRGDAGAYTRHVAAERLAGFDEASPQVLVQIVQNDDTVPNSANGFFARGIGAPLVGDELWPLGVVAHEQRLPTSGNRDADHTWGTFEFDVLDAMGTPATHSDIGRSEVAQTQIVEFLQTWEAEGVSTILDPYRVLDIKP